MYLSPNVIEMLETASVGDSIGYDTSPNHRSTYGLKISRIKKITKTQIHLECGRKFRKNGSELKSQNVSYPRAILTTVEYVLESREKNENDKNTNMAVENLLEAIKGHQSSWANPGMFHISEETKSELMTLVSNIPTNVK